MTSLIRNHFKLSNSILNELKKIEHISIKVNKIIENTFQFSNIENLLIVNIIT